MYKIGKYGYSRSEAREIARLTAENLWLRVANEKMVEVLHGRDIEAVIESLEGATRSSMKVTIIQTRDKLRHIVWCHNSLNGTMR